MALIAAFLVILILGYKIYILDKENTNMKQIIKPIMILSSVALLSSCNVTNLRYSAKEVREHIDALCENGLYVEFEITNYESLEGIDIYGNNYFGAKGDIYWAKFHTEDGEENHAIKVLDYGYNLYDYSEENKAYIFKENHKDTEDIKTLKRTIYTVLNYANNFEGMLSSAGEEERNGRMCDKYEFAYNSVLSFFGAEADFVLYVDQETGITFEATQIISTTTEDTGFSIKITDFVNEGVEVPTLIEANPSDR